MLSISLNGQGWRLLWLMEKNGLRTHLWDTSSMAFGVPVLTFTYWSPSALISLSLVARPSGPIPCYRFLLVLIQLFWWSFRLIRASTCTVISITLVKFTFFITFLSLVFWEETLFVQILIPIKLFLNHFFYISGFALVFGVFFVLLLNGWFNVQIVSFVAVIFDKLRFSVQFWACDSSVV